MRTLSCFVLTILLGAGARSAAAQDACGDYLKTPAVGDWVEHQLSKDGEPEMRMRFAIVGTEQRAGKDLQWFEMALTEDEDEPTIFKILVPGYPFEPDGIEEVVMKAGDSPAMKMGGPMLATIRGTLAGNPGLSIAEECKAMQSVGQELVTVPGGTFQTQHYRNAESGTEAWLSTEIPFGRVRSTDEEYTSELIGHGQGAETAITEKPQDLFGS